jgi:hypothetical protein
VFIIKTGKHLHNQKMATTVGEWKCSTPEYSRVSENGTQVPMYRFKLEQAPHDLVLYCSKISEIEFRTELAKLLAKDGEYHSYMAEFFEYILTAFGKLFVKKHAPAAYVNALQHSFLSIPEIPARQQVEYTVVLNPVELTLKNGRFIFVWSTELSMADVEDAVSEVGDIALNPPEDDIIEVNDIDESVDTGNEIMAVRSGQPEVLSDKQYRDRQRVEEARLRAKLAAVRAERALERYIQKYGDYESELSSDDGETTDGGDTDF